MADVKAETVLKSNSGDNHHTVHEPHPAFYGI